MAANKNTGTIGESNIEDFQKSSVIQLLQPSMEENKWFQKALEDRKTTREISDKKLSLQLISNLLWSAYGVNRKNGPFGITGRTAASASNSQEIDLYVTTKEGTYLYDGINHSLVPVLSEDLRSYAIGQGQQGYGAEAPLRLIYIADTYRLSHTSGYQEPGLQDPDFQRSYYFVDTGFIAANVYLFCAAYGLACWFHNCNKQVLIKKLNLNSNQRVLFGQTVGYPE